LETMQQAVKRFARDADPSHFVTLTVPWESPFRLHRAVRRWLGELAKEAGHVRVFFSLSELHCVHLIMRGLDRGIEQDDFPPWTVGRMAMEVPRSKAAVSTYTARHEAWDTFVACPRKASCRRPGRGCRHGTDWRP